MPRLDIQLGWAQSVVFRANGRFKVLFAGRRFGKTHLAAIGLLDVAVRYPKCRVWYTAPTFIHAKRFAWPVFKTVIPRWLADPRLGDLAFELINGSLIELVGRQDPDNLRGPGLKRIVNDEFAIQKEQDKGLETWETVLRPMLSDTGGDAWFIGTPRGYNWGYDLFLKGQDPEASDWNSFKFTTLQGRRVPQEEVESAKRDMDPRRFRQEYEASFETLGARVYDNFDRFTHVDEKVEDVGGPLLIGQDFNVHPMASVIAVKVGDECHVLDSLEIPTSNTQEVCEEVKRRFVEEGKCEYAREPRKPEQIIWSPDPTGKKRQTSAGGKTDFSIIEGFGFKVDAPSSPPAVADRINNVQANLLSADGQSHVKIHPRAKTLIRALESQEYKPDTSIPDRTGGFDHTNDAFGYLLWRQFNLFRKGAVIGTFAS